MPDDEHRGGCMTPLVAPPFGRDVSCSDQIRYGVVVSGDQLILEDAYRRLSTDRGSLDDVLNPDEAANYGYNLLGRLNHGILPNELRAVESAVVSELTKSPRLTAATCSIVASDGNTWTVSIALYAGGAPIPLALNVNDVSISILGAP